MPDYLYRCNGCKAEERITHRALAGITILCDCDTPMHRVPQEFMVQWNGLKPSQGDPPKVYKELMATKAEREQKFYEKTRPEHERRTQNEN